MPAGVYYDRRGYFIRKPYRVLASTGASRESVLSAYADLDITPQHTLRALWDAYKKCPLYIALSGKSQYEYDLNAKALLNTKTKSGTLGDEQPERIDRPTVYRYLDLRESQHAAVKGKREIAALSVMLTWGINTGRVKLPSNPCFGLRRKAPKKKVRPYVDDAWYSLVMKIATDVCAPWVPVIMEFMRLAYLRKIEAVNLRRDQVEAGRGVHATRTKGSGDNMVRWSAALDAVHKAALALPGASSPVYLITDERGQKITTDAFDKQWAKVRAACKARGIPYFDPHSLKVKACSDSKDGNPAEHKDPRMAQLYKRSVREIDDSSGR